MPIDPNIALQYRAPQIDFSQIQQPVNQMAQVYQLQQAKQQNQLGQMQMAEYERARESENQLRNLFANPEIDRASPDFLRQIYAVSPTQGIAIEKNLREAEAKKIEADLHRTQKSKLEQEISDMSRKAQQDKLDKSLQHIASFETRDDIIADINAQTRAGNLPMMQATQLIQSIPTDPAAISQWQMKTLRGILSAKDRLSADVEQQRLKLDAQPAIVKQYNFAKTPEGGNFKGSILDYERSVANAGRAPAQPTAPVAVLDPVTGKAIFVSREQAISKQMSPVSERVELAPKEIQKREAAYPSATSAVKGFETKSDSFINDLKALRDSKGLDEITGFVAGRAPGITGAGRKAQALYDKIVAKGGFQALQDLRDASKTGGALGNVSNQEGKQLTASFAAIDRRQSAADVRAALDQAIADVEGSKTRVRESYDSTYDYRTSNRPAAGNPSSVRSAADAILGQ